MKKYIIVSIITLSVAVVFLAWYFWYKTYHIRYLEWKSKECYIDTQKIKPDINKDHWNLYEQIYSQKMWTCIYSWIFASIKWENVSKVDLKIKELYSNKVIEVENLCGNEASCHNLLNDQGSIVQDKKDKFSKLLNSYK